ncbi:MAG: SRPBCC domain-containing protein [Chitinophagales bacterium]
MANDNDIIPQPANPMDAKREIIITRVFDAPRELVFKVWTDPNQITRWWGPKDFTAPFCKLDLRVGGEYLYCMRSSEGKEYWSKGVFREIIRPEKIVYTDSFADAQGNTVPASEYGMEGDWSEELIVSVTFEEYNGKTKFTLKHEGIPAGQMSDMTAVGWNESFDKLAEALKLL